MASLPVISIVGRPNVGKSCLFNRIIGKRIAVVDDMPGVTRDRNYMPVAWNGMDFSLVDTGGLVPNLHDSIPDAIHYQVDIAVQESVAVLFVVEAGTGPTDLDLLIARQLRKTSVDKVILVANKAESKALENEMNVFLSLGLGAPVPISALHGQGVADLLDRALKVAKKRGASKTVIDKPEEKQLKIAIAGRPNAGKSSLVNRLLGANRMIVDDKPGTTRDAVDSVVTANGETFVLIDTAGLRKKSHVKQDLEYYSNLRAIQSIERADICVLVIDVEAGLGIQDLRILRKIIELRKGVLLAWNKWDIHEKDHRTFDQLAVEARREFIELRPIPMISMSALTGQRVTNILEMTKKIYGRMQQKVPSAEFEDLVFNWVRVHPHKAIPKDPVRFLGARQINAPFPLFRFFVTNPRQVDPSYERYLQRKIYETYDFEGCPVVLEFRPIAKG